MQTALSGLRALLIICASLALVFTSIPASAFTVSGAIGHHYKSLGGASSRLGDPTGSERCGLRDSGCYQSFKGGSIHWSRASGAHATWAAIRNSWQATGWENGPLGYPTTNERCGLRGSGCYQTFQGGSIHWSPTTGARATWGAIRNTWRTNGWENGRLGYPRSGEYNVSSGGKAQDFEFGRITWRPGQGTTVEITVPPAAFHITGSGFGHGVGMSQYGARGMAAAGSSARQILEHYYNPARVESITTHANADIRVQLLSGTQSVTISPVDGMLRVRAGATLADHGQPITLSRTSDNRVRAQVGDQVYVHPSLTVEWQNTRAWPGGDNQTTVSVPGARSGSTGSYRHGSIEVSSLGSSLNLVNVLRVNTEYLRGIAEVPTSWHQQALRAQAIAARTYAYRNLSSIKSDCNCHLYDEVRSQVFAGWAHESGSGGSNWTSAVAATQSGTGPTVSNAQVVRHNGSLIEAFYSSSSSGVTNRAADVWGSNVPYLQERDDSAALTPAAGNPNATWTTEVTQDRMRRAFGLGDVAKLEITRTGSGMVKTIRATSSGGQTATRTGPELRTALGLRSATFHVKY